VSAARRLVLASGNLHKVAELARLVAAAGLPLRVSAASELGGLPAIVEDASTFRGNAILKARGFAGWLEERGLEGESLVLADDSGICVDALEGAPGVLSARFAGPGATDAENNARLVAALASSGLDRSAAHYVCVLALRRVDGGPLAGGEPVRCFEGRWHGEVRAARRGEGGFGYDPHFWLDGGACTVAELSAEAKGARSHRGAATQALLAALPELLPRA
jgi:XTP/dITP diphosphohydrolase